MAMPPDAPQPATARKTNHVAVAAFGLGLASVVSLLLSNLAISLLSAVLAITFGMAAPVAAKDRRGDSLASAGIVMGTSILCLAGLVFALVIWLIHSALTGDGFQHWYLSLRG
jgi:hypothetical protein